MDGLWIFILKVIAAFLAMQSITTTDLPLGDDCRCEYLCLDKNDKDCSQCKSVSRPVAHPEVGEPKVLRLDYNLADYSAGGVL